MTRLHLRSSIPASDRFWKRVDRTGDCWEWTGGKNNKGYGVFYEDGRTPMLAPRFSFFLARGYFPKQACHTCDNPGCVNPDHIYDGTPHDNHMDMVNRGRATFGARNGRSKLSEDQVRIIVDKIASGERVTRIAREFGVSHTQIVRIKNGTRWSHLGGTKA